MSKRVNRKLNFDEEEEEDDSFVVSDEEKSPPKAPTKRRRSRAARRIPPPKSLDHNLKILHALTKAYKAKPSRWLAARMRKVIDRIEEPAESEEEEEELSVSLHDGNQDVIVNISDRVRLIHPHFAGDIPRDTLLEIGRLARIYHLQEYHCNPPKGQRIINGKLKDVNLYTEETAPSTVDRAIREFFKL